MSQPWPVLLLVRALHLGGCERDLTKIALGLDRARFQPHVGCFHAQGFRGDELRAAGVPILELPVRSFRSLSVLAGAARMGEYLKRQRIRLVHSYDAPTTIFGVPAARLFGTPRVVSSQLGHRDLYRASSRRALRLTDPLVDCLVVNCAALRRHMIEDEKISPRRLYLCYNGVDTSVFHPLGRCRTPELAGAALVIGVVCVLRPEKRIDLLLEAFAQVRHLKPGMKLAVVGSGDGLPACQALAQELGLGDDCLFQPATPEVATWLRAMDVFVLPSSSEAFSNALLEAMACGCCPLGSRVGGTPELVAHGERGLLFEPGSASDLAAQLALLVTRDDLRASFGAAAARFAAEQLPVGQAVRRMEDLYGALLEDAAVPP